MLVTEWNWDDALDVRFREGREEGQEKGREEGREKGRWERDIEIAKNALAQGMSPDMVSLITGLNMTTVTKLAESGE
ncbi:MAG: hypothetical protein LBC31_03930 [Treponema sp.]|nr:hypothetical protein [Treponema sp.]